MKQWTLILLLICLTACEQKSNEQTIISSNQDSLSKINTETTFIDTSALPMYFNMTDPVIIADTAVVYSKPDSSGRMIDKLYFDSPLSIVSPDSYWQGWYELNLGKNKGYVPVSTVAAHKFKTNISGRIFYYYVVTSNSAKYNPIPNSFTIYKFDSSKKQFTDTFAIEGVRADLVKEMNHNGWKNGNLLLYTKQVNAYCGGGETELYLIDANNEFKKLFSTYAYTDDGEGGGGRYATVVLPKNVDTDTIVLKEWEESPESLKNGKFVKNKDGSPKTRIENDTTKYFCWDGKSLILVRTSVK
jgi:hypothetical protein